MRILHISTRLILGGSQENTVLSCEGQASPPHGHEVHLAFGPIYGPEGSLLHRVEAFRTPSGAGITTHVVPDLIRAIHPLRDLKARRQLAALIDRIRPDVVHTHSSKAGILGRAAAWAARRRPAVVHTIHGPPFHDRQNALVRRVYIASERWAARRCHRMVCVADAMREQYLAHGIGLREQYSTVYSGMEVGPLLTASAGQTREEVRAALGLGESDFVIATVARLAELKGHDDVLDALGPLMERRSEWRLLWVGDGWWRQRLLARARAAGISTHELDKSPGPAPPAARLLLTGLVPPDRIAGLMRAADVLVHPSYREGLPRTVPQALLCGTPVVASDTDGTGEACIDFVTGRLVPTADRAALASAVEWTSDHRAEAAALAAAGRELCRDRFSAAAMVSGLEAVYASALESAKTGRNPGG